MGRDQIEMRLSDARRRSRVVQENLKAIAMTTNEMIDALEAGGEYRVLRRFQPATSYGEVGSERVGRMCVIDFETTGTDDDDVPIEIGMVLVEYDMDTCTIGKVLDRYCGQEDPGFELDPNIVALTGITDEDLKGKRFDDNRVAEIIRQAGIVVAHQASFDRGMGEKRFAFMAERPWGCSMNDVPWKESGIGSVKLEFIAVMKGGVFYDAHRADVDAEVTAFVLGQKVLDGKTGLWHLLQRARRKHYRVWATDSPFATKDLLKARGYRWCDSIRFAYKAWRIETVELHAELEFLRAHVYGSRGGEVVVEELGVRDRFSERREAFEPVQLGHMSIESRAITLEAVTNTAAPVSH